MTRRALALAGVLLATACSADSGVSLVVSETIAPADDPAVDGPSEPTPGMSDDDGDATTELKALQKVGDHKNVCSVIEFWVNGLSTCIVMNLQLLPDMFLQHCIEKTLLFISLALG